MNHPDTFLNAIVPVILFLLLMCSLCIFGYLDDRKYKRCADSGHTLKQCPTCCGYENTGL